MTLLKETLKEALALAEEGHELAAIKLLAGFIVGHQSSTVQPLDGGSGQPTPPKKGG